MEENIQRSIIRIERKARYVASARKFKIFIDGKMERKISTGEVLEFYLEPGIHEIYLKIDWSKSKRIKVNVSPGGTTDLICGTINGYIYFASILLINYLIFWYRNLALILILTGIIFISSFIPALNFTLREK